METIEVKDFIYKFKIEEHKSLKETLLESIKSMGTHSMIEKGQEISNTDWHLGEKYNRPYADIILPILEEKYLPNLCDSKVGIVNYWFQQYNKNDYHKWHAHGGASFSSVYFLELPDTNMKTAFQPQYGVDIDVKEGDYIVFPAHFLHRSNKNTSNHRKTSIIVNLNTFQ